MRVKSCVVNLPIITQFTVHIVFHLIRAHTFDVLFYLKKSLNLVDGTSVFCVMKHKVKTNLLISFYYRD